MRVRSLLVLPIFLLPAHRKEASSPWFIVIRGASLVQPAVIRGTAGKMNSDILALEASLQPDTSLRIEPGAADYEVAEFWGPEWMPDSKGRAPQALHFESAGTFAKIYRASRFSPPIWVGRMNGRVVAMRIGNPGRLILEHAGLRLGPLECGLQRSDCSATTVALSPSPAAHERV